MFKNPYIASIVIAVCAIAFFAENALLFGKLVNRIAPCVQNPANSFPCYGVYDIVAMVVIAIVGIFFAAVLLYGALKRRFPIKQLLYALGLPVIVLVIGFMSLKPTEQYPTMLLETFPGLVSKDFDSSEAMQPLPDGTDVPWAGTYHAASPENGLKTYASTTIGVSVKYPADYLLFTREDGATNTTINIAPATPTLHAIDRAKDGAYGEAPGAISISFFPVTLGEMLSLPVWLAGHTNVSNFDPANDPAIKLSSTTVAGFPGLSYHTSLGLAPFEYRVLVHNGQVILISAMEVPEQDFDTVLNNLIITP